MNEQRRDFFKNSALGLATITLGAGLSLIPSAQAEEKPSNTATTAVEKLPEIEAELTLAPNVPKPIERNYPAKVVVKLTALEQIMDLMDGVQFKFWTLNGSVPAPFIRVREGDMVEVQLSNSASSMMPHSLDFHAAPVPMGGQWQVKPHQLGHQPSNLERYVRGFIYTTAAANLWIFTLPKGCMV